MIKEQLGPAYISMSEPCLLKTACPSISLDNPNNKTAYQHKQIIRKISNLKHPLFLVEICV